MENGPDHDHASCNAVKSFVMYSTDTSIQGISTDVNDKELEALAPISKIHMATAIDFYAGDKDTIFWADSSARTISRINRDLTGRQTIVEDGLNSVEGIAVDWAAENIYWTDAGLDIISVAKLDGRYRRVLISGGMDKPRAIVVHPEKGFLFWADWGSKPKITRARLDGSHRTDIVNTSLKSPVGLAIDYKTNLIYWCDRHTNRIEYSDMYGIGRRPLITTGITDCMAVVVDEDYIYWTDATDKNGCIKRANKTDGSGVIDFRTDLTTKVKDVTVFAGRRQDKRKLNGNTCYTSRNDICKELCFYLGEGKLKCDCSHGTWNATQGKCIPFETFLLYSVVDAIMSSHLIGQSPAKPIAPLRNSTSMKNAVALAIDYEYKRIFFSDIQVGNIQSITFSNNLLNGSHAFQEIVPNVGSAEGLAYDYMFQELYWTSYTNSCISRISVSFYRNSKPQKIIQLGVDDHPRAIVIDSCDSRMYWTNWNVRQPSISRSGLSGYDINHIITTDIQTPNGLAIDHKDQKLYWADARLDRIERCDLDGSNRFVVLHSVPHHGFGLAVHKQYVYWTDWILRSVMRANKYNGARSRIDWLDKKIPHQPMGIVAFAQESHDCTQNACYNFNGGCQQICQVNVTEDERSLVHCACNPGYQLSSDNVTCHKPLNISCPSDQFKCEEGICLSYELTCNNITNCQSGSDEDINWCSTRMCPSPLFTCLNRQCIPEEWHCNGVPNCGDGSDELGCSICGADQWECTNHQCIGLSRRCNKNPDCTDASDEINCPMVNCSKFNLRGHVVPNMIPCNFTTACIQPEWICDGQNDCWDKSDEENCQNDTSLVTTCATDEFKCIESGYCIPNSWKCDTDHDCCEKNKNCTDLSDEVNCNYTCGRKQFECHTSRECIPMTWQCDGQSDCPDHSDESKCSNHSCSTEEHRCGNGRCVPQVWICDGDLDCSDGSDEHPSKGCRRVVCEGGEFQCNNLRCIRRTFVCDGDNDCGDRSDESEQCVYKRCQVHQIRCRNNHCIAADAHCDGYFDCDDQSDEENCGTTTACSNETTYACTNGVCIDRSLLCNKQDDCGDASDEALCGIDECKLSTSKCDQTCVDRDIGFVCKCNSFYKLRDDKRTCQDIDECKTSLPCSHYCQNTIGGYRCSCHHGYKLQVDGTTCKATDGIQPYLILANRYYIRNITLDGHSQPLVTSHLSNAVAVDFDWKDRMIYWTDVTNTGSSITRMLFNNSNLQVLHKATLKNPDGLAVDWIARNLYWCDKSTDTIEVSTLSGKYRKVILKKGLQEPRALEVYPAKGYLFYTDWGDHAHIGRLGMDGSEHKKLITDHVGWPNAMTIDYITDHIFWADAKLDYIAMANLDGENRRTILQGNLPHIFAMTQFEDSLFWTDWEHKSITRCHKYSGANRKNVTLMIHRPMDVHVLHPYRQLPLNKANPCAKANCPNLCLIKPGGDRAECVCPENHYLGADSKTCYSNCSSSEFACPRTYRCIPFWWQCDGYDDCGDRSDENTTTSQTCPPYYCNQSGLFQCSHATSPSHCIPPQKICDGIVDCHDNSDENSCEIYNCLHNYFKCNKSPNHKCIPANQKCDSKKDCENGEDELQINCPPLNCSEKHFQCKFHQRCIPLIWRCDGDRDCPDGSDELPNCKNTSCPPDYQHCEKSGKCFPNAWRCDGDNDCGPGDNTDEKPEICKSNTCDPTYFHCANNRCIPGRWRCDYDDDCGDHSDEKNCSHRNCSESERRCDDGKCIRSLWWCNGEADCADGSDETHCSPQTHSTCPPSDFKCTNGYCIPSSWRCDKTRDCPDGSDELRCNKECSTNEFQCKSGLCIPLAWRCDGDPDCTDQSDEEIQLCKNASCVEGRFKCDQTKCILKDMMCNGQTDCQDGTDEDKSNCPSVQPCDGFKCNTTNQCIDKTRVCDRYNDCPDESDEGYICHTNKTCIKNDRCEGACIQLIHGIACTCPNGEELKENGYQCRDVNECRLWGKCEQDCENKHKKYHCLCATGYRPKYGSQGCKALGSPAYILVSDENQLRYYSMNEGKSGEIYKNTDNVRINSLDIDTYNDDTWMVYYLTNASRALISKLEIPKSVSNRLRYSRSTKSKRPKPVALPLNLNDPNSLAVDWVNRHLYWTDAEKKSIEMSTLDGKLQRTVIQTNIDVPHSITVEPILGKIFWSDWGVDTKIECANLDGSNRTSIVNTSILWPTDLAIDHANKRLYWADPKTRKIETVNFDGSDRHTVKLFKASEDPPHRLDVFESYVIVSTYRSNSILKFDKFARDNATTLVQGLLRIGDVVVVQENKQTRVNSSCTDKKCGLKNAMCIPAPNTQCVCADGYKRSGANCIKDTGQNTCSPKCLNGGSCVALQNGVHKCRCPPHQFTGTNCQNDLCNGFCKNKGVCYMKSGKAACRCDVDNRFTGVRCEKFKCTNYCFNNGYCYVSITGFAKCLCTSQYTGKRCEIFQSNQCEKYCEGKGTKKCIFDVNRRPTCLCDQGYQGDKCKQCVDRYCDHGGQCEIDGVDKTSRCFCDLGFIAEDNCTTTVCDGYCRNNATCSIPEKNPSCLCPPEFEGQTCENHVCDFITCSGHGQCEYDADKTRGECTCKAGWKGNKCEFATTCNNTDYCLNSGTCHQGAGKVSCTCAPLYTGQKCEVKEATCDTFYCHHNGDCVLQDDGPFCKCRGHYMGADCSTPWPSYCLTDYCFNGGTCIACSLADQTHSTPSCQVCACPSGYDGKRCQHITTSSSQQVSSSSLSTSTIIIISISTSFVFILLLVGIIIFIVCKRRNKYFHFKRMLSDTSDIQITNEVFDENPDDVEAFEDSPFVLDPHKPTNFSNPMYDTLYQDKSNSRKKTIDNEETGKLLLDDDNDNEDIKPTLSET